MLVDKALFMENQGVFRKSIVLWEKEALEEFKKEGKSDESFSLL